MGKKRWYSVGGHHHGFVAGDVGLRRQHVHALRAAGARRGFKREGSQLGQRPGAAGRRHQKD
jgi:hypothetical protein